MTCESLYVFFEFAHSLLGPERYIEHLFLPHHAEGEQLLRHRMVICSGEYS